MAEKTKHHHFLLVAYPLQSHVNQGLNLAKHLARSTGAAVTFSTAINAHRRMFPSISKPDQEVNDGLITFKPFSDGFDDGYLPGSTDPKQYISLFRTNSQRNLSALVNDLAAGGRPVTCIIRTMFLEWVVDLAGEHGIPSVLYWIQPATAFATYYHFFHGFKDLIRAHSGDPLLTVRLPGLQPLQIKDLPSFITDTEESQFVSFLSSLRELFQVYLKRDQAVLVNSFTALETEALASVPQTLNLLAVGSCPSADTGSGAGNLFKEDEKKYMEWLDTKEEGSVVYISFGSVTVMKKQQTEEMVKGLKESNKSYLWVVRKDNREDGVAVDFEGLNGSNGMVVEWCSQVRVLAHRAVGCFVTHCGWNSTLESLAWGVPMVCVPQWSDQGMNAKLVESLWGCGVRSEVDGDGVVNGGELVRCLELVMGDGEKGVEIRRKAKMWKDKALEAVSEGGSSDLNLRALVEMLPSNIDDV